MLPHAQQVVEHRGEARLGEYLVEDGAQRRHGREVGNVPAARVVAVHHVAVHVALLADVIVDPSIDRRGGARREQRWQDEEALALVELLGRLRAREGRRGRDREGVAHGSCRAPTGCGEGVAAGP
eukprot:6576923-Prymnesium_polylepis.1